MQARSITISDWLGTLSFMLRRMKGSHYLKIYQVGFNLKQNEHAIVAKKSQNFSLIFLQIEDNGDCVI